MLREVQRLLLAALIDDDPAASLRTSLAGVADLTAEERAWLESLPPDGLRMTGLIVKKLRFERLTRGDAGLARLFEEEPQAFVRLFRNYTGAIPPTAYFPREETAQFRDWRKASRRDGAADEPG